MVKTTLIIFGSPASIKRRRDPGIIRGSPLLQATRGSDELWVTSPPRVLDISLWLSLQYWTVKVFPLTWIKEKILLLNSMRWRWWLVFHNWKSQTETLVNIQNFFKENFVCFLGSHWRDNPFRCAVLLWKFIFIVKLYNWLDYLLSYWQSSSHLVLSTRKFSTYNVEDQSLLVHHRYQVQLLLITKVKMQLMNPQLG